MYIQVTGSIPLSAVDSAQCSQAFDVGRRSNRHDARGIDLWVRPIVVFLDMRKVGRILEGGIVPVEILEPSVEVRVGVSDCGARATISDG